MKVKEFFSDLRTTRVFFKSKGKRQLISDSNRLRRDIGNLKKMIREKS